MPTKPDPVLDLPPLWGINGNYSPGVYGLFLPWGDSNPLAGQPLPWGNQPRLNSTGLTSFANTGLTPQVPTDGSLFNEWLRRVGIWATEWVALGTDQPDADAHIVESAPTGLVAALGFEATATYQGAANTPAPLGMGFIVPNGETSTFGDNCIITGGAATAPAFDGYQLASEKASAGDRVIHHLAGEPRYDTGAVDDYLLHGTEPWGPVGSVPALDAFGPTSAEIDGPSVEVTLTGTAFIFVSANGVFVGTAGDTEVGIRVEVDSVDVYDLSFTVSNTDRQLVWSTSFAVQEGAGTFDAKIKFRRSAGSGSVNLGSASIFAVPY